MLTHVKVQQQLQAYQQSIQAGRNSPCRCAVQCVWQSRAIAGPAQYCSASMLAQQRCRLPAEQVASAWACRCIRIWGMRPFKAPTSHWTPSTSCQTVCCVTLDAITLSGRSRVASLLTGEFVSMVQSGLGKAVVCLSAEAAKSCIHCSKRLCLCLRRP